MFLLRINISSDRTQVVRSSAANCVNATLNECVSRGVPEWWAVLVQNLLNGAGCVRGANAACEYAGRPPSASTSSTWEPAQAPASKLQPQVPAGKLRHFYEYVGERGCLESLDEVHAVCAGERESALFEETSGGESAGDSVKNALALSDAITSEWAETIYPADSYASASNGNELDEDARALLSLIENETLSICLCATFTTEQYSFTNYCLSNYHTHVYSFLYTVVWVILRL